MAPPATFEEVAELLGEAVDHAVVERLVATTASVDEIAEAIDDVDHEVRLDERREPSSVMVAEVRTIIEGLPLDEASYARRVDDADGDQLTIVGVDELEARH